MVLIYLTVSVLLNFWVWELPNVVQDAIKSDVLLNTKDYKRGDLLVIFAPRVKVFNSQ